jgi:hypothetical protein
MKMTRRDDKRGEQKAAAERIQESRKGGYLLFLRRKAPWQKNGCEIGPCCAISWRRPLVLLHRNWPKQEGVQSVGSRNGASD